MEIVTSMVAKWRAAPAVVRLLLAIAVLVVFGLLAGCSATGVRMTDEEAAACAAQGCTVWTEAQLGNLTLLAFRAGFVSGQRASAGRELRP